jgi:2-keto-4-pentenoate hydratase/2-oxohepta-3-ene-1,7-dioic acid hydratase in catechol pathway
MRLCRFDHDRLGVVEGDTVRDVSAVLDRLPALRWPLPPGDPLIARLSELLPAMREAAKTGREIPLSQVKLLSPVANPAHVVAAPLNYKLHVDESSDPAINHGVHMPSHEGFATPIDKFGLFLKSQTGLIGPSEEIELHFPDRRNDHEVELAVIIGKPAKNVKRADAMDYIAGYSIGLDITVRGPQDRSYRKSADTYSVLGPWLVTPDEISDPGNLMMEISVDGELRQRATTADLICDIPDLIERTTAVYRLYPGDIIMTGTPEGVGQIWSGATLKATIAEIGTMEMRVR